jgi:hypothetical protein
VILVQSSGPPSCCSVDVKFFLLAFVIANVHVFALLLVAIDGILVITSSSPFALRTDLVHSWSRFCLCFNSKISVFWAAFS